MSAQTQFPGTVTVAHAAMTGLQHLRAVVDAHMADDGQVYAKLDASWTAPQLERLGIAEVSLTITLSSSAPANLCTVILVQSLSAPINADEHVWNLDIPADYAVAKDGDQRLMIDMIWRHARYNDARGVVGCAICATVEQVLATVADEWLAARKYMTGLTALMEE